MAFEANDSGAYYDDSGIPAANFLGSNPDPYTNFNVPHPETQANAADYQAGADQYQQILAAQQAQQAAQQAQAENAAAAAANAAGYSYRTSSGRVIAPPTRTASYTTRTGVSFNNVAADIAAQLAQKDAEFQASEDEKIREFNQQQHTAEETLNFQKQLEQDKLIQHQQDQAQALQMEQGRILSQERGPKNVYQYLYGLHGEAPGGAPIPGWQDYTNPNASPAAFPQITPLVNPQAESTQPQFDPTTNPTVYRMYQDILGRAPESQAAIDNWNQDVGNAGMWTAAAQMAGSPEALSRLQGTGDPITALYQDYLGRAPDPGGYAAWQQDMQAKGLAGMMQDFFSQPEVQQHLQNIPIPAASQTPPTTQTSTLPQVKAPTMAPAFGETNGSYQPYSLSDLSALPPSLQVAGGANQSTLPVVQPLGSANDKQIMTPQTLSSQPFNGEPWGMGLNMPGANNQTPSASSPTPSASPPIGGTGSTDIPGRVNPGGGWQPTLPPFLQGQFTASGAPAPVGAQAFSQMNPSQQGALSSWYNDVLGINPDDMSDMMKRNAPQANTNVPTNFA